MTPSRRAFAAFAALFLAAAGGRAQDYVVVDLDTNAPDAVLFADSVRLGEVRSGLYRIPAATRVLRLAAPGDDWSVDPLDVPLAALAGDTVRAVFRFPYHHRIETVPFGASAYLTADAGRISLGLTPVVHTSSEPVEGHFVLEHRGYIPVELAPGREVWNQYLVEMHRLDPDAVEVVELPASDRRYRWLDWSAAVVAVAAGAVSVHYKFRADKLDDRYRETGDPVLRPDIAALDDRAYLSLGLMQAGIGVLAIRFILR